MGRYKGKYSPQPVLVRIADLLEDSRGGLGGRRLAVSHGEHAKLVLHNIRYSLCVGSGAGSAAPDRVVHLGQLVCNSVRDVGSGSRSRVGA